MVPIDPDAARLNDMLRSSEISGMLSSYGKRAYFPKGIVAQSQEAATAATLANATAGVALEHSRHMTHRLFGKSGMPVSSDQLVSYAPTAGDPQLRSLWLREMIRKNPSLANASITEPVVCAGLTHAIAIAADLFVDAGDAVVIPSPCWDNYHLIFSVEHGARVSGPGLFDGNLLFSWTSLERTLWEIEQEKIVLLLNFPNNPTGFTPSEAMMAELVRVLVRIAEHGKRLVVIVDDAYFGLFHDDSASAVSLFSLLCAAHERILAIKCDAATKESLVWGFRIGFITYGVRGLTKECAHAMVQKTMGVIRSSVSSCARPSQSLLTAVMQEARYREDTDRVVREMARRFAIVRQALSKWVGTDSLRPYPCNSGYFCAFACSGDPEQLRRYLLERGIGTVALEGHLLRIAYSGVDPETLEPLIDSLYQAAGELWT